jgi:hypothetical protein
MGDCKWQMARQPAAVRRVWSPGGVLRRVFAAPAEVLSGKGRALRRTDLTLP